ncbi:MAG TPA: peptidoglycan-binding domain-containing protein [Streptomyces sp.]
MHTLRRSVTLAATAALAAVALGISPASASVSQGSIQGSGSVTDDWGDEGPLSMTSHPKAYANGLWQWVLYAEGVSESNDTAYDKSDIDCVFGSNTAYATKRLQARWGLTADGSAGPNTLGRADNKLTLSGSYVTYHGAAHDVRFIRNVDSHMYVFPSGSTSGWTAAAYGAYAPCASPS